MAGADARRLPAEVLLDALSLSTGVPDEFPGYPVGIRAGQLPDPTLKSYFLTLFGRSERVTACACERNGDVTMPQLLHLQNGDSVINKIKSGDGRLTKLLKDNKSEAEIVEELYLATLSRPPADEVRKLAECTTGATKEIAQMIRGVQEGTRLAIATIHDGTKEVELGVASTRDAGNSLREIIEISDRVGEMVTHMATSAQQQSSATENVTQSTERIADIAAATANGAIEATKAMEDLANLAGDIQRQLAQFRLEPDKKASEPSPRLWARAAASGR